MPTSLATDGDYIYVGDFSSSDVLRYSLDGQYLGVFIDNTSSHTLSNLHHIAFDEGGNLYASPVGGTQGLPPKISKYDQNGDWLRDFQHVDLVCPSGVAVDAQGVVYVSQSTAWESAIYKFSANGSYLERFAALNPADLDIDREAGILFEARNYGTSIRKYSLDGTHLGDIPLPGINYGSGMYFDPFTNHIFATGWASDNAVEVSLDGTILRTFSGGEMGSPWDIIASVPEPATLSLLAIGGLALIRRKHR